MSNTASPTRRRVLGDKNPNAPLQMLSPRPKLGMVDDDTTVTSPLRRPLKHRLSPEPGSPSSPRAGQKRRISELEEEHADADGSQVSNDTQPLSQVSELLSDAGSDPAQEHLVAPSQTMPVPPTTGSSFHASQEEQAALEPTFEIHDEMSQQTLDKIHAVNISQDNTSAHGLPSFRPSFVKDPSQISLSMSSLIDFDENRSSQSDSQPEADEMEVTEETAPSGFVHGPRTEGEARKDMLLEKAQTLRTRLQLALFKVQTNQVSKPFSRLQLPTILPEKRTSARSSSPDGPNHRRPASPYTSSLVQGVARNVNSPESRIAAARARATMEPKRVVKDLGSLPLPKIVPTAFSARWNDGDDCSMGERVDPRSPTLPSFNITAEPEPRTPLHHAHPTGDDGEGYDDGSLTAPRGLKQGGLTSSVVKGEAASGLLELMRGVGRCSNGGGDGEFV